MLQAALAVALHALAVAPAWAQWQGAVGAGVRDVSHAEYDGAGRRLVREAGSLPGVVAQAAYTAGRATWFSEGEFYSRDIGYHGQTQAGAPAATRTSTATSLLRFGAAYALDERYSVSATLAWQRWERGIIGVDGAAGLQERYQGTRLAAGARRTWRAPAGALSLDAAVVLGGAERLRVGFSGLLDPASLALKRSQGISIGAVIRPAFAPRLELRAGCDWIRTPRSADAPVTRDGQFMGTIAQPELRKRAMTLTITTIFG